MKKKNLWALIPAAMMMASCGGTPTPEASESLSPSEEPSLPESEPSEPVSESSELPEWAIGWNDEEIELMQERLAGNVLPYYEANDIEVYWDDEYESVVVHFEMTDTVWDDLIDLYTEAGYEAGMMDFFGLMYIFTADIYDANWNDIYLQGFDLDGETFELCAWLDVPTTAWPGDEIADFIDELGSDAEVPALETEAYFFENASAYDYLKITCAGGVSVDTEDEYVAAVEELGWTVSDDEYEEYGYIAVSEDGLVELEFYYVNQAFLIYIYPHDEGGAGGDEPTVDPNAPTHPSTCVGFPSEYISDWLEYLGATDTSIPSFDYAGTWYADDSYLAYKNMYWYFDDNELTLEETEEAYLNTLIEAGYTIDSSEYEEYGYYAYKPGETYQIQFFFYEGTFMLGIGPNAHN